MSAATDWRWVEHKVYGPVALTVPAVRMVIVTAWKYRSNEGEVQPDHEILPVLALRTAVAKVYNKRYDGNGNNFSSPGGTHRELINEGWVYDGGLSGPREDLLIISEGVLRTAEEHFCDNERWQATACTWPPEEDGERLAPIVAELLESIPDPK